MMDPIYLTSEQREYELMIRNIVDVSTVRAKTLAIRKQLALEAAGKQPSPSFSAPMFETESEIQVCSYTLRDLIINLEEAYSSKDESKLTSSYHQLLHTKTRLQRIQPKNQKDENDVIELYECTIKELKRIDEFQGAFSNKTSMVRHSLPPNNNHQSVNNSNIQKEHTVIAARHSLSDNREATRLSIPHNLAVGNRPSFSLNNDKHESSNRVNIPLPLEPHSNRPITPEQFHARNIEVANESLFEMHTLSSEEQEDILAEIADLNLASQAVHPLQNGRYISIAPSEFDRNAGRNVPPNSNGINAQSDVSRLKVTILNDRHTPITNLAPVARSTLAPNLFNNQITQNVHFQKEGSNDYQFLSRNANFHTNVQPVSELQPKSTYRTSSNIPIENTYVVPRGTNNQVFTDRNENRYGENSHTNICGLTSTQRAQHDFHGAINNFQTYDFRNHSHYNNHLNIPTVLRGENESRAYHVDAGIGGQRPRMNDRHERPREPFIQPDNTNPRQYEVHRYATNRKPVPVNQWRISFSGDGRGLHLYDFLSQVTMYQRAEQVSNNELRFSIVHLLTGRAKMWYQSIYDTVDSWEELVQALRAEFLPNDYNYTLFNEISNRRQKPNESFGEYVTQMKSLFKWLGMPISEQHKVFIVQRNLSSKYAIAIAPLVIWSLHELTEVCKRIDNATSSANRQNTTLPFEGSVDGYRTRFNPFNRQANINEIIAEEPLGRAEGTEEVCALTRNYNATNRNVTAEPLRMLCWNCEENGHSFRFCPKPRVGIFCYICGNHGVIRSNCDRCSGNADQNLVNRLDPQDSARKAA